MKHHFKVIFSIISITIGGCQTEALAQQPGSSKSSLNHSIFQEGLSDILRPLTIGDTIPASIWKNIPKKSTTQLVILDFWSTSCTSCMAAFPKMVKLQQEFDEKLHVVLVNTWEDSTRIMERINKMNANRVNNQMEPYEIPAGLPAINGDSVYKYIFPSRSVPHHVWVSNKGVVLYITHGYNATPLQVERVLRGERPTMVLKDEDERVIEKFKNGEGFLSISDRNADPRIYSGFFRRNFGYGTWSIVIDSTRALKKALFLGLDAVRLYQFAFDKRNKGLTLLDIKNAQEYYEVPRGENLDEWNQQNAYTYEIGVPLSRADKMNEYMQGDLNRFFAVERGIEGKIEKRRMKCLLLVRTEGGILATAGGGGREVQSDTLIRIRNSSFSSILIYLRKIDPSFFRRFYVPGDKPLLDETGIDPKLRVDIELRGDLKNLAVLRQQLHKYGLDIVEGERELEMLVIRDIKVQ